MKKYPIKKINNEIEKYKKNKPEVIANPSYHNASSFISFRYSYTSLSSFDGKTYIKSKKERFENGKFESEEFEGVADGNMYVNAVQKLQKSFFQQFFSFFNPLSFFLPFFKKDREDR